VAKKLGFSLEDFAAVLKKEQPVRNSDIVEEIGYFATVTAQVLRRLGGEYAKFADELEGDNRVDLSTDVETIEPLPDIEYRLGGTLHSDENSYIKRQADEDLYNALKAGNYCIISAPRQMGKSSLILRVMNRLKNEGFAFAQIDLSMFSFECTEEQWYDSFIHRLILFFPDLQENFDLQKWWENQEKLSANQRFIAFIETVLLKQINENITIILDEFDCILTRDYSMIRDFPYLLKSFYNKRVIDKDYSRLNFVLSGVDLLRNQTLSPIANIAQEIELKGFTYEEALPLAGGLAEKTDNPQELLKYILEWTGGQPFLTQKICSLVKESKQSIPNGTEKDWLDNLVRTQIIENWEFDDNPVHFGSITNVILHKQKPEVLSLYESILQGEGDFDRVNEGIQTLMSTGLVIRHDGKLRVANKIYESVFDQEWIEKELANILSKLLQESTMTRENPLTKLNEILMTFVTTIGGIDAVMLMDSNAEVQIYYPHNINSLNFIGSITTNSIAMIEENSKSLGKILAVQEMELVTQDRRILTLKISTELDYYLCIVCPLNGTRSSLIKAAFHNALKNEIITCMKTLSIIRRD